MEKIFGQRKQSNQDHYRCGDGAPEFGVATLSGPGQKEKSKAKKQEADRGIRLHRDAVRKDRGEKADIPEPAEQYQAAQEQQQPAPNSGNGPVQFVGILAHAESHLVASSCQLTGFHDARAHRMPGPGRARCPFIVSIAWAAAKEYKGNERWRATRSWDCSPAGDRRAAPLSLRYRLGARVAPS